MECMKIRRAVLIAYVTMAFAACIAFTATRDIFSQSRKAPNFAVYSVSGKRFVFYNILKKLPSRGMVILNFTSVYCKPCRREIPELLSISERGGRALRLVCIYAESGKPVSENARELGVLEAYVDPFGTMRSKFGVKKIPVTILIDRSRTIMGRFEGYTKSNIKSIKKIVIGK